MKFSKILLIIGSAFFILGAATPDDYGNCHSDLTISGYNDPQNCFPDFIYEFGQAAFYVGIASVCVAFYLMRKEKVDKPADIFNLLNKI